MKSKEEIEQLAENNANEFDSDQGEMHYGAYYSYIKGYTKCQEDMMNDFLSLIEEYREKELPNRNVPYHYEAEIDSGLNFLIEFIKNKQD